MFIFAAQALGANEIAESAIELTRIAAFRLNGLQKCRFFFDRPYPGFGGGVRGILTASGNMAVQDFSLELQGSSLTPLRGDDLADELMLGGGGGLQPGGEPGKEVVEGLLRFGLEDNAFGIEAVAAAIACGSDFSVLGFRPSGESAVGAGGGDLSW